MPKRQRVSVIDRGEGSTSSSPSLRTFSSGCTLLDCVLGGGWPLGRVVNIVGDKSTGKTLLAIEACANFAREFPDGRIVYLEAEAAFDKSYARNLGLPVDLVEFPENLATIEDMFENLETLVQQEQRPTLYVVDSLDAISDAAETDRGIRDAAFAMNKQKKLSELFRRLNAKMSHSSVTLMIVSQVRDNIGVTFGDKTKRSGGRALDFYATHVIFLAHIGQLKKTRDKVERAIGIKVTARCKKNKLSSPFRECTFPVIFEYGVEDVEAGLQWLIEVGATQDTLGLSEADAAKLIKKLGSLSAEEYLQERTNVSAAVRETWHKVEDGFRPTRRKYV